MTISFILIHLSEVLYTFPEIDFVVSFPEKTNAPTFQYQKLLEYADDKTTFEDLFYHMNTRIISEDFVNLDFLGNLGHSIEKRSEDRIYIEKGNRTRLSDIPYFTFEPHISRPYSLYGYKHENIYYFENGKLKVL